MWNPELNEVLPAKHESNLETPVQVTVLKHTDENKQAITIYETSANKHYKQPVD